MARALTIGDPHFKVSNIAQVKTFLEWLHSVILEYRPDFVVNLGDTFHTHNVIRSEIMAIITWHIEWMIEHGIPYYILVGNHDMAHHKTSHIHALLPFKGKEGVFIVDEPVAADDVGFMPYMDEPEAFLKEFDELTRPDAYRPSKTVFCHQPFLGADMGFIKAHDGVPVPDWNAGEIVSGHIHREQQLGCVWYPGTPYAQEAADNNLTKGIYLYDTESRAKEFIESPMPRWRTTKIAPSAFEEAITRMNREDRNHLVLQGPASEVNHLLASREFQDAKKRLGFSVKKELTEGAFASKTIRKTSSVQDAVVEYVDKIYEGKVDKNRLKDKCISALQ